MELEKYDEELIPPQEKIFIGEGDFRKIGENFVKLFVSIGGLKPDDRVLDIGCGIGRMAAPLATFLSPEGSYDGTDIVKDGIDWCNEKINSKYPNFRFWLDDIYNSRYNPNGLYKASEYEFPFENNSFDFIFLTSVFTHMLYFDTRNYFYEIRRMLKKGGKCFATFFLLNNESEELMNKKLSRNYPIHQNFKCYCGREDMPEAVVAYKEEDIFKIAEGCGLELIKPVYYGNWCGRKSMFTAQDILLFVKK